jgi:uncharacterized membrane protein
VRVATITYLVILAGALLWCGALIAPPLLIAQGWYVTGAALYQFFHPICHQLPERSLHLAGYPLAVCMRCSSIYFAFLAGVIALPLFGRWQDRIGNSRALLFASLIPMILDVGLDFAGIHASSEMTRILTGALFGAIIPFFIVPVARNAVRELLSPSPTSLPSDTTKGTTHA